jgi:hypothetical protein
MRRWYGWRCCAVVLLALLGAAPWLRPPPAAAHAEVAERLVCFVERNHCAENAFLDYWERGGGVEILGYPIDQVRRFPDGIIRQFYERAILEWHPENEPQYQVLLTRLGAALVEGNPRARQSPVPCDGANCTLFRETNHTLRGVFRAYWLATGGLATFGYPLTEAYEEVSPTNGRVYLVQYFERNRFEYHPENAGGRYEVLLGLLGDEALLALAPQVNGQPLAQVPNYGESVNDRGAVVLPQQGYVGAVFAIIVVGLDPNTPHTVIIQPFLPPGSPQPPDTARRTFATDATGRLDLTFESAGVPPGLYRIDASRPDGRGQFLGQFTILAR